MRPVACLRIRKPSESALCGTSGHPIGFFDLHLPWHSSLKMLHRHAVAAVPGGFL